MALSKIDVANMVTGAVPVANGGTALTSGFKNGITEQDMYRITSDASNPSNTNSGRLLSNWERVDTRGFAQLGTGISQSSGIFSFPSTGHYLIQFIALFTNSSAEERYCKAFIEVTEDNSSYDNANDTRTSLAGSSSQRNGSVHCSHVFDVTNTTNDKFKVGVDHSDSNTTIMGDSNVSETYIIVTKLADT